MGALVAPLFALKSPDEARFVIETLALLVLAGLVASVIMLARPLLETWAGRVAALAVVTSGWMVFAGHTSGYLDRVVELYVLGATACVGTRARWLAAPLLAAAVYTHELALLYGLPVIAGLTWLAAKDRREALRDLAWLGLVVGGAAAILAASTSRLTPATIGGIEADLFASGLLNPPDLRNATFHLQNDLAAQRVWRPGALLPSITRPDLALVTFPAVGLFLVWAVALTRRALWLVPLVFAPFALHVVAWDTARFDLMVVFQSAILLFGVARLTGAAPRLPGVLLVLGLLVLGVNLTARVPLMERRKDGDAPLAVRTVPTAASFERCAPAFPNAGFEAGDLSGWAASGDPFDTRKGVPGRAVRTAGTVGDHWATTEGRGGDRKKGEARSPAFTVSSDLLLVAVGGGSDPELYAAVEIDGERVVSATGTGEEALTPIAWDLSAYRGRTANVVVHDGATGKGGHLNVDGFCWYGRGDPPSP